MISLDLVTSAANDSANASAGQSELHSNGWLLELERAWLNSESSGKKASQPGPEARTESSPADAGEEYSGKKFGDAPREVSRLDTTGSLEARLTLSSMAASASNLQFDPSMSAAFASLRQALDMSPSASQPAADEKMASALAGTKLRESTRHGASEQSSLAASTEENSNAADAPPESDATYPEKRLHLLEDEHGIRVWIRDAALSEERGYAVANALRAELGAAGLRLAAVALNGKEISGNDDPLAESGTAPLEQDSGYVRSMIDESNISIGKLSQKEHS